MMAQRIFRLGLVAVVLASASCGGVVREGTGTSFLIIQRWRRVSGAQPDEFGTGLQSDVVTVVDDAPTIFNDLGRVTLSAGMKDPGPPGAPTTADAESVDHCRPLPGAVHPRRRPEHAGRRRARTGSTAPSP